MDDRDKDLTHLFVRDLDEIPLPARGVWRRTQEKEQITMRASRALLTAGAAVAVLVLALVVGLQLRDRSETAAFPSTSPRPSATASAAPGAVAPSPTSSSTASPTPAASTGAILNDAFGFLVSGGDGVPVARFRPESSTATTRQLATQSLAVSPDGKQIAYWTLSVNAVTLQLQNAATGAEQTLVSLAAGERGGGVIWSNDGAGVLYSYESGSFGIGAESVTNRATLAVYELAAGGTRVKIDTQINTGFLYRPITWDRTTNLAAAGLTGEGGFLGTYLTVRINPDKSLNASKAAAAARGISMGSVKASTDAKFVLGVGGAGGGDILFWPIDDFGAIKTGAVSGRRGATWRPGTHQIGYLSGEQFWLGDVDTFGPLGLCCTAFSGAPLNGTVRLFRIDGSAVLLATPPAGRSGPGATTDFMLVRIGGDAKATSGERVTFTELGGPVASVRLR